MKTEQHPLFVPEPARVVVDLGEERRLDEVDSEVAGLEGRGILLLGDQFYI